MMKIKGLMSILLLGLSLNVMANAGDECVNGDEVDWDCLCIILCQADEGGAACNCDDVPQARNRGEGL